jgi:hypothetical protein
MPNRDELHKLIDSLPEGAIEPAHRMLSHLQVWPPPAPPGAEEMRQRMKERRTQAMQAQRPGTIAGFAGGGNYDPAKGVGYSSFSHWRMTGMYMKFCGGIMGMNSRQLSAFALMAGA